MTKERDFDRLAQITSTGMDVINARMQSILREEARVRKQIETLQMSKQSRAQRGSPAQHAAADVKWQIWIDHRREELNMELAQVLVKKDTARSALKKAFGKDQTVKGLQKKLHFKRVLEKRRQLS